jgi:hypothetical protein
MELIELALSERLGREIRNPATERVRLWLAQREAERLVSVKPRCKAGKPARRKARKRGIKV